MNKEEIKDKIKEIEESYEKISSQIKNLQENKFRLEGQYSVFKGLLEDDEEEELEEIGD